MRRTLLARSSIPILLSVLTPGPAWPSLEEFENWSVAARELDDENGLDDLHRSYSPVAEWRWRALEQGARVGMGCATTQVWEVNLDAKLHREVSGRVTAGFQLFQQQELGEEVSWTEFAGAFRPTGNWWIGAGYRPAFEKESHDAALYAGYRRDWTQWVRLRLGFEDALNNFWDDRTEYIEDKERQVYAKPPRELELAALWREGTGRGLSLRAVYLPEYEREFTPRPTAIEPASVFQGNGWLVDLDLVSSERAAGTLGLRFRTKGTDRETTYGPSTTVPDTSGIDRARLTDTYVRPWGDLRLADGWRLRSQLQARWSSEEHFDGLRDHLLGTNHLGGTATAVWSATRFLDIEFGLGLDRVRVEQDAERPYAVATHGDRTESRAILSLDFHWNGARIVLFETLEGDNEGYQTVGFHDKGFAHLVLEF